MHDSEPGELISGVIPLIDVGLISPANRAR